MDDFIITNNFSNSKSGSIYRCLRETLYALKIKNIPVKEVTDILVRIYDEKIVESTLNMVCSEKYLDGFHHTTCFNCNLCDYIEDCRHRQIVQFHEKIFSKYLEWREK